jgi:hypothetical protein
LKQAENRELFAYDTHTAYEKNLMVFLVIMSSYVAKLALLIYTGFFIGLLFDSEDSRDVFLRNVD